MNRIKQVMRKPLSESDLRKILGEDTKILTYPQLAKYNTVEELLPKPYDFCIILLLETQISGHWTALIKNPSQVEFFDSYGNAPDADLTNWLSPSQRIKLKKTHIIYQIFSKVEIIFIIKSNINNYVKG